MARWLPSGRTRRQGREAQEPSIRLPPSVGPNPGEQQMIQLASPSVSCRQSRPFGFRFWGGTSWLSTSRLEAAVCLVSVGCLLLRLSSGVGDGPRGGVCGFLAHWGFACLCRGKWRLKSSAGDDVGRRRCCHLQPRAGENVVKFFNGRTKTWKSHWRLNPWAALSSGRRLPGLKHE